MHKNYAKDLFQLQSELVDTKVEMAVNKAIERVLDKINDLKHEMHDLRHDMNNGFSSLDKRVVAIETRLGIIGEKRTGFTNRLMDYIFKAGYGILTLSGSYLVYLLIQLHLFVK